MHELTGSWLWLVRQGLVSDISGLIVLLLLVTFMMMGLWRPLGWFQNIRQIVRHVSHELGHLMMLDRRP